MGAVLFDLEGTLVDTEAIAPHREARAWRACISRVDQTMMYPGVQELLAALSNRHIPWGIVTNIPSMLADAILEHHEIAPAAKICFHDVPRGQHKPHPAMCLKALGQLGVKASGSIGVGDTSADAQAFKAAVMNGYCAGWNQGADRTASWTGILRAPAQVLSLL
jgi:phosphoglycolate phosphatase-like HAD superfamily hydrolase